MATSRVAKKRESINSIPTLKVTQTGRAKPGPLLDSPEKVFGLLQGELGQADRETFIVLHLNTKNELVARETVATGSLSSATVHPREVFKGAVLNNSASIICVHNHPSGNPEPSPEDFRLTQQLVLAGDVLGIGLLDHVIIGAGRFSRVPIVPLAHREQPEVCGCSGKCSDGAADTLRSELLDVEDLLDQVFYQVRFLRCTDWRSIKTNATAEGCDIILNKIQGDVQTCREKTAAARRF
ncbi:MAG: JAB domain-containing protein [Desulfuromonadales bacterium]